MNKITFITTSRIKIKHAEYLLRKYNVKLVPYRHLHYGVSYDEPRINDRDELLRMSIKDAKIRWEKYAKKKRDSFFFIEDTSVIVEALSSEGCEVPGVDIKYWMQENTFESIDIELKKNGNNRNVIVQSHVVLYLSQDLKHKEDCEYKIFKSNSEGTIATQEFDFKTNLSFPWLDNKTFNKWFVPNGYDLPISMLSIEEADKVDFRAGAFNEMLKYLEENKKVHKKKYTSIELNIDFSPFFIICGPTCAGKTTIAKYLSKNYGFYHIEASDFMTQAFHETHGFNSKIDIGEFAKSALENNPNIVVDRILNHLKNVQNLPIVITGFRSPKEIETIEKIYNSQYLTKFFIDSNFTIRFDRWVDRRRSKNDTNLETFIKTNELQSQMGLNEIENECQVIKNDSSYKSYYSIFDDILAQKNTSKQTINLENISNLRPMRLEDAILISLFEKNLANEKITYHTTTEISHIINKLFYSDEKKSMKAKDNVSRYFNQKVHPYFEVKNEDDKLRYTLSPTGESNALLKINQLQRQLL